MLCEICGKQTGSASRVVLDGAELVACPDCAGFGDGGIAAASAIPVNVQPKRKVAPVVQHWQQRNSGAVPASESAPTYSELGIAENYGEIIRHARERLGLTLKELGEKVFEKESVLHKVERGKFVPDERLGRRLEATLGISIGAAEE